MTRLRRLMSSKVALYFKTVMLLQSHNYHRIVGSMPVLSVEVNGIVFITNNSFKASLLFQNMVLIMKEKMIS